MMPARDVRVGAKAAFQGIAAHFAEERIQWVGADTAFEPLKPLRQLDERNSCIEPGPQEECDRETLYAGWGREHVMDVGADITIGREFQQFSGIDDKSSRNRRRVDKVA